MTAGAHGGVPRGGAGDAETIPVRSASGWRIPGESSSMARAAMLAGVIGMERLLRMTIRNGRVVPRYETVEFPGTYDERVPAMPGAANSETIDAVAGLTKG